MPFRDFSMKGKDETRDFNMNSCQFKLVVDSEHLQGIIGNAVGITYNFHKQVKFIQCIASFFSSFVCLLFFSLHSGLLPGLSNYH